MSDAYNRMVIHCWSGPRSLSTCTMYSFGQRSDTHVLDEPLYASWLSRNPSIFRPYRDELLSTSENDGNKVLLHMLDMDVEGKPVIFAKHVAKQFAGLDKSSLFHDSCRHIFLVRDPIEMIDGWQRKFDVHREACSLETLGLPLMCELFSEIRRNCKFPPIVVDADLLQKYPRDVLMILCGKLAIPFEESQLQWKAGPKPDLDG